ncbi:MAG TPA: alpha-L-arabinofuranosidase C-terminal domain-containing protein [Sedimentisphaerales bacterium]|nr:alpha-L-arabinofuranosidase C-terminal domain-containing protein [Sedimentisphaerales bacterium]HRS12316.1 alpha-L-arabinofuranosidase C-terminal domain-containing protein [Sedimentisphaerales bacterium]HRV48987.1 alpha-L-arabinofuranosidase C-terminal domain-containing protein [Sedimentisphaerales bacterium]
MAMIHRRDFLRQAACTGALLLSGGSPLRAAGQRCKVEVLLDEPIGMISPDIYGHFAEHIGGVIYDGIWVGEESAIPNYAGMRKSLVDCMRRLKPSVVRWPGGCFADSYNWRDGVGPRRQRPSRPNFWINTRFLQEAPDGPAKYEPNEFGTNEFIAFCRLIGAEPYLAANVRSASARDFYEWIEYCNAPAGSTTLARQREANGCRDPFRVRFWGVGNESWGCGGDFTPQEYATEFRRFTSWVPHFDAPPRFIAAGPNSWDESWTRGFFEALMRRDKGYVNRVYGWGLHYYYGTAGKGALDFGPEDWYELLRKGAAMERLIQNHWAAMGEYDTDHRVKLAIDEWGTWHPAGTEVHRTHLFGQTSTLRDALVAALTLDIFNRHADKVIMANIAQLVNNLQSLFLAHEDRFIVTPNFHVFEMYAAHQKGQSLRTVFSAPEIRQGNSALPGLAGSASLHGKRLVLTVVNPSITEIREAQILIPGATIRTAAVRTLSHTDIRAHNSFENPDALVPLDGQASATGTDLVYTFPPASVVRMTADLA